MDALGCSEAGLSILLTDDRRMAQLHQRWMGDPAPTDVLSFPQDSDSGAGAPPVLGDVAISVETAQRRSPQDPKGEVLRYLIHGLLHLKGFDHLRPRQRQQMTLQARRLYRQVRKG